MLTFAVAGYPPIAFMFRGLAHACLTQGMYPTPSGFFQTDWRMKSESSSSLPPLRIIGLRSWYSVSKRQDSSFPSEVSLILSQASQKGSVIGVMTPSSPLPSGNFHSVAVSPDSRPFGTMSYRLLALARISAPLTMFSGFQIPSPSSGMNSINRMERSLSRANSMSSRISSSL